MERKIEYHPILSNQAESGFWLLPTQNVALVTGARGSMSKAR